MWRVPTTVLVLLATALIAPAAALAGPREDYVDVYEAYQAKGTVDGCAFSSAKLASAKKGVPPNVGTYAPDFPDALDAALRRRAPDDCETAAAATQSARSTPSPTASDTAAPTAAAGGAAATTGTPGATTGASGATGAGATPAPAPNATAAPAAANGSIATAADRTAQSTGSDDVPFPLVLLAVLTGLALLTVLVWALLRFLAVDPPWLAAGRHATAEAGWRASASWAEFTDWVRLGR